MARRMRLWGIGTRSPEAKFYDLARVETQTSMHTGTNLLSTPSLPDQISENAQKEGCTYNKEAAEAEEVDMEVAGMLVPNGSQGSASQPEELEMQEMWASSRDGRPSFCPSPESWADATTKALAHLRLTGMTPQVPEVPQYTSTSSPLSIGVTSPSPPSLSRVADSQVRISASSHFDQAIPGVSQSAPSSTGQITLTPLSKRFQSQELSKPTRYLPEYYSPTPSNRSTEPPRQTQEKKQRHQHRYFAIYSNFDYLTDHEGDGEQKPAQSGVLPRPHQVGGDAGHSTSSQTDPLGDLPRCADRSPILDSVGDNFSCTSSLLATRTNERQGSLTSHETALDMMRDVSPGVPSHRPLPSVPQRIPHKHRGDEPVAVTEGTMLKSSRDDYPLYRHLM